MRNEAHEDNSRQEEHLTRVGGAEGRNDIVNISTSRALADKKRIL